MLGNEPQNTRFERLQNCFGSVEGVSALPKQGCSHGFAAKLVVILSGNAGFVLPFSTFRISRKKKSDLHISDGGSRKCKHRTFHFLAYGFSTFDSLCFRKESSSPTHLAILHAPDHDAATTPCTRSTDTTNTEEHRSFMTFNLHSALREVADWLNDPT